MLKTSTADFPMAQELKEGKIPEVRRIFWQRMFLHVATFCHLVLRHNT